MFKVELLKRWRGTAEEDKVLGIGGNNGITGVVVIAARRGARGGAPLLGAPLVEDADEVALGTSVPLVVVATCANGTLSSFGVNSGQRLGLMTTSGLTKSTGLSRPNTPDGAPSGMHVLTTTPRSLPHRYGPLQAEHTCISDQHGAPRRRAGYVARL